MTEWRGLVRVQRQIDGARTGVLIRSQDGKVFRIIAIDDTLIARFGKRTDFYAIAVISRPIPSGVGQIIDGWLELGDEVIAPEQWDI